MKWLARIGLMALLMTAPLPAWAWEHRLPELQGSFVDRTSLPARDIELRLTISCLEIGIFDNFDCGKVTLTATPDGNGHFAFPEHRFRFSEGLRIFRRDYDVTLTLGSRCDAQRDVEAISRTSSHWGPVKRLLENLDRIELLPGHEPARVQLVAPGFEGNWVDDLLPRACPGVSSSAALEAAADRSNR